MRKRGLLVEQQHQDEAGGGGGNGPSLDDIAADASVVAGMSREAVRDLYHRAAQVEAVLRAHILTVSNSNVVKPEQDRLLLVEEAAKLLATSTDTLYTRWKELPFAFKDVDGKLKFSEQGIARYIEKRTRTR